MKCLFRTLVPINKQRSFFCLEGKTKDTIQTFLSGRDDSAYHLLSSLHTAKYKYMYWFRTIPSIRNLFKRNEKKKKKSNGEKYDVTAPLQRKVLRHVQHPVQVTIHSNCSTTENLPLPTIILKGPLGFS